MEVTVTGGDNHPPVALQYNEVGIALAQARLLAASIDKTFSSARYYSSLKPPHTNPAHGGYLIATEGSIGAGTIDAHNFQAVVIQNTGVGATVMGGGKNPQTVLASNGGMQFTAVRGETTVVAGGGNNNISFMHDHSSTAVYISNGDNTIYGGQGASTIAAGTGNNKVTIGGGSTYEVVSGTDTIRLRGGTETIHAVGQGSALIEGSRSVKEPVGIINGQRHFSLNFIGNGSASTVLSGAGSYHIRTGSGGGVFHGGKAGGNVIMGGVGAATIFGGGTGDLLRGGSGSADIVAGSGNETLVAGSGVSTLTGAGTAGDDVFKFNGGGHVATVDVTNFTHGFDFLNVHSYGSGEEAYALSHFSSDGTNGSFTLTDGTKVVLDGVTHLTASDFK